MKKQNLLTSIKNYLKENEEAALEVVRKLNSLNGSFENINVYENDEEFFNTFFLNDPMAAVRAAQYGEYNYCDEYVRFNSYRNLESLDGWQLLEEVGQEVEKITEALIDNQDFINILDNEINYLLDQLEEIEE
jgi:hypothetical protein